MRTAKGVDRERCWRLDESTGVKWSSNRVRRYIYQETTWVRMVPRAILRSETAIPVMCLLPATLRWQ